MLLLIAGSDKLIVKSIKYIRRLYYACPFEVVSVLLDLMQLDAPESPESSDMQETHNLAVNHSYDSPISNSNMKTIIMRLSEKEPRLLLSVLKSVIEMIDAMEELTNKGTLKSIILQWSMLSTEYSDISYKIFHKLLNNPALLSRLDARCPFSLVKYNLSCSVYGLIGGYICR